MMSVSAVEQPARRGAGMRVGGVIGVVLLGDGGKMREPPLPVETRPGKGA